MNTKANETKNHERFKVKYCDEIITVTKFGMTLRKITLHFKRYKIFLVLVLRSNLIFESFPVNFAH